MPDQLLQQQPFYSRLPYARGGSLFFALALAIFLISLLMASGLLLLGRAREQTRDQLIEQNAAKEEALRPELLDQIVALEQRLKRVRTLIDGHVFASNIFRMIEANTHPAVRFSNFVFAADGAKIDMNGEASGYRALARQIGIFEREPQIERVEFGGLATTGEGRVGFKLSLIIQPALLHLNP